MNVHVDVDVSYFDEIQFNLIEALIIQTKFLWTRSLTGINTNFQEIFQKYTKIRSKIE